MCIRDRAPADLKKTGPLYDLPIFLGLLAACGQTHADFSGSVFLGELTMNLSLIHI